MAARFLIVCCSYIPHINQRKHPEEIVQLLFLQQLAEQLSA
jgi:hypothetical protein